MADQELQGENSCLKMAQSASFLTPQLLKHALGSATSKPAFELYYLYYDCASREADVHLTEIQDFRRCMGEDFPFHVGTYQEVYARIRDRAGESDAAYLAYLDARYFA